VKNFSDKVALITGAGSGIGRALALELATSGCSLALVDWNKDSLEETKQLVRNKNISVSTHPFDISDREKIATLPEEVLEFHKQIDIVINNAGVSVVGTVEEVDDSDWNWGLDILLNSVIQMTTVFLPHLKQRPEAAIVNVSSIFGLFSVPRQSIYNVGKFGVKAFTESLSLELKVSNSSVDAYCVFPGHIGTNIYNSSRFKSFEPETFFGKAPTKEEAVVAFKNDAPTSPEKAAKVILKNIKKKNNRILIGFDAHFYDITSRLFPNHFLKIIWILPFLRHLFRFKKR
jgi:short-subunit dehydrogenase|tara:strand:+ start:1528 stop:2391 length:864 start_codon:yes stop_codon:yes gene_type:complete